MSNSVDYWKEIVDFSKQYSKVSRQIDDTLSAIQEYEDQYGVKAERVRIRLDRLRTRMDSVASGILKTIGTRGQKATDLIREAKKKVEEASSNMGFVLALAISEITVELQTNAAIQTINPMLTEQRNREELTRLRLRHETHLSRDPKDDPQWMKEEGRLANEFATLTHVVKEHRRWKVVKTVLWPLIAVFSLVITLLQLFGSISADLAVLPFIIIPIGLLVLYFPRVWTRFMFGWRVAKRTTLALGIAVIVAPIVILGLIGVQSVMQGAIPLIDRFIAGWAVAMLIAFYFADTNLEPFVKRYREEVQKEFLNILGFDETTG